MAYIRTFHQILFSVAKYHTQSRIDLNSDFIKISQWTFQWKMNFNPNPNKQAQELIFYRKSHEINSPLLISTIIL